jgi:hypothetical protein
MRALTRAQKRALAAALINEASVLVEFWEEKTEDRPELAGVTRAVAADQLAVWLKDLPGTAWSNFLPSP